MVTYYYSRCCPRIDWNQVDCRSWMHWLLTHLSATAGLQTVQYTLHYSRIILQCSEVGVLLFVIGGQQGHSSEFCATVADLCSFIFIFLLRYSFSIHWSHILHRYWYLRCLIKTYVEIRLSKKIILRIIHFTGWQWREFQLLDLPALSLRLKWFCRASTSRSTSGNYKIPGA